MATAPLRLAAVALCLVAIAPALPAAAPKANAGDDKPLPYVAGEKWTITSSVSMPGLSLPQGMNMPGMGGQKLEVCQAKGLSSTEAAEQQKDCTITNKRMVGNKRSAHMVCKKEGHTVEGDVEMESLGPDHYRTTMHMQTDQGAMDMVSEGQKTGGECDANESQRKTQALVAKANALQAQTEQVMSQQCHDMATGVQLQAFGKDGLCKDPADTALLCKSAQGYKGLGTLLSGKRHAAELANDPNPYASAQAHQLDDVVAFCANAARTSGVRGLAFNPDEARERLCTTAEKDGELVYLAENCPVQADPLGQKVCASGMEESPELPVEPKYQDFCRAWLDTDKGQAAALAARAKAADKIRAKGGNKQPTQADKAKEAIDKAKSKLKGLFGGG